MSKKSTRIAIGGVFSSLCLLLMFLTGVFPFASYVMPAFAGAMLIVVKIENGQGTAVLVYISVSLLSLFMVPDIDAKLMFICFLGYYPIIREWFDRLWLPLRIITKLALFNMAVLAGFWFVAKVLGIASIMEGMGDFGKYTLHILLALSNVVFLLYDYVLAKYTLVYIYWLKPRYLRR